MVLTLKRLGIGEINNGGIMLCFVLVLGLVLSCAIKFNMRKFIKVSWGMRMIGESVIGGIFLIKQMKKI